MSLSAAFGHVLKRLRGQRSLSQSDLADLSELDRTYISLLERGQRQPTLSTLFALARALKITPNELVTLTQRRMRNPSRKPYFIASKRL